MVLIAYLFTQLLPKVKVKDVNEERIIDYLKSENFSKFKTNSEQGKQYLNCYADLLLYYVICNQRFH